MRVLIVDDYPGAAQAALIYLELLGHECRAVTTGAIALETVATFDPDVVLLDIGLPDLSGYEVAREIRARATNKRVFIVALTGWARPDDRVKSIAAGIDMHVLKPPRPEVLAEVLALAKARQLSATPATDRS